MKTTELTIAVIAADRAGMQRELDEAVNVAVAKAMQDQRCGILVTRHGFKRFTVTLTDAVPFGLTREHQDW
ncbi:hypothetical protein GCM10023346_47380 [Arthrobacter gyeryongensis]|uniref:Uncharacterized protein n=1 Tax=Arthrobacter gyeryongensis TaxID=1650592 RepID=A0ABP9SUS4_9MICC